MISLIQASQDFQSQIDNFFDLVNSEIDINTDTCNTVFDISKYVPLWVVFEKQKMESEGQNPVTIFDFLQKYYDWLYCDESDGARYTLSQNLLDLIDIEKTKEVYYKSFISIYLDGFDSNLLKINGGQIETESFIQFVKDVRKNLYQKKTTLESVKYFFNKLFSISPDDIQIYYPKQLVLRLNGGRFYNDSFKFKGGTGSYESRNDLAGSYLNGSRMQDSDWIQDFSYLMKVGLTADIYRDTYLNMMHPAGLKVVFENTITDYQGPGDGDIVFTVCESPLIGNYFPYGLTTSYTTQIGTGPDGVTPLYGLTACVGCADPYDKEFEMPTHVYPNWTGEITASRFFDINITDMFQLCYVQGFTSPNYGLTCGGCP
jgi:hypothetical protein